MPRRTVTIALGFDKAIRGLKGRLIPKLDRDVTFTEAPNYVLFTGILRPWPDGKIIAFWREGDEVASEQEIVELKKGYDFNQLRFHGWLDCMGSDNGHWRVSLDPDDAVPGWMVGEDDFWFGRIR